jgi:hypothetical protein
MVHLLSCQFPSQIRPVVVVVAAAVVVLVLSFRAMITKKLSPNISWSIGHLKWSSIMHMGSSNCTCTSV